MKNFEFTGETKVNIFGITLFRIKATAKLKWAEKGEIGGWIEKEDSLENDGNA
jgi:hypothetical protein